MEQDTIKQPGPMAVYHYSASVSREFHGPEHYDGVITCPIISDAKGYADAKRLIAEQASVGGSAYLIKINSLSFVGETQAPAGDFIGPAGETQEVITYPRRKVVIVATNQGAGDARFWPMIVDAINECSVADPMGCEEDFTATNGVRLRFSWPTRVMEY